MVSPIKMKHWPILECRIQRLIVSVRFKIQLSFLNRLLRVMTASGAVLLRPFEPRSTIITLWTHFDFKLYVDILINFYAIVLF